jgi:hypothetical protein
VGSTLTCSLGTSSGTQPITSTPSWLRCDVAGLQCAPIMGAAALTYVPAQADLGSTLRPSLLSANSAGSATAASAATMVVVVQPVTKPPGRNHSDRSHGRHHGHGDKH